MSRFFIINEAGAFYSHALGRLVSWGPLGKANEWQTAMSCRYISDKYPGSRVVELKGKNIVEV